MPRRRPTKKLGVYGKYDINPEQAVSAFVESKLQNKLYLKKPEWDCSREGFELIGVQTERALVEAGKHQEEMREQTLTNQKINERRIQNIWKVQADLKEQFIEVNTFIQNCRNKEFEANEKIQSDLEKQKKLKDEIGRLSKEVKELSDFEKSLGDMVQQFQQYEDTINAVVEESPHFDSLEDMMAKCDALMLAQLEISEKEQEKLRTIEEIRQKMVKATNEAAQIALSLDNELEELQRSYREVKNESFKWEKILATTKDYISENELITNRLLDSINQLYRMLCKRNETDPQFKRTDPEKALDYIKDEIEMLQKVVKLSNEELAKQTSSLVAEKGSKTKVKNPYLSKFK